MKPPGALLLLAGQGRAGGRAAGSSRRPHEAWRRRGPAMLLLGSGARTPAATAAAAAGGGGFVPSGRASHVAYARATRSEAHVQPLAVAHVLHREARTAELHLQERADGRRLWQWRGRLEPRALCEAGSGSRRHCRSHGRGVPPGRAVFKAACERRPLCSHDNVWCVGRRGAGAKVAAARRHALGAAHGAVRSQRRRHCVDGQREKRRAGREVFPHS
eukprot:363083-Chlamydomonas_euryale.AAC.12